MGTIKRLNDAQQRLQDAENAMPGAYDDQYAQGIADTLDKMGTASGAGFDFTTADSGYKDALTRMVGNANAGADAAAATADALSGGYGADYAKARQIRQQRRRRQTPAAPLLQHGRTHWPSGSRSLPVRATSWTPCWDSAHWNAASMTAA